MKENNLLLLNQRARRGPLRTMFMKKYHDTRMNLVEANSIPWVEFNERITPFAATTSKNQKVDFIAIAKNFQWTTQDFAIFAGRNNGQMITQYPDFLKSEASDFFELNLNLSSKLLKANGHETIQFSFGFNPQDYSPGHHSLMRFHSHFRSINPYLDHQFMTQTNIYDSNWFQRLAKIEPFVDVAYDIFNQAIKSKIFAIENTLVIENGGYITMKLPVPTDVSKFANDFKELYLYLRRTYREIESIYTERNVDPTTNRYIPLPEEVRRDRFLMFIQRNGGIFREISKEKLQYLVTNLRAAVPRSFPTEINSAGQVYITKGFAGGFSFTQRRKSNTICMDFFPRIITTTGPTKNLFADARVVGFQKISEQAPPEALQASQSFLDQIQPIFKI